MFFLSSVVLTDKSKSKVQIRESIKSGNKHFINTNSIGENILNYRPWKHITIPI